jgi:hypothetical protein
MRKVENIDDEIVKKLLFEATNKGVDLNTFILTIFKQAVGMETSRDQDDVDEVYHDLDYLAGTWTEEEAESFVNATKDFRKVDNEL